ncbi:hypothetical protein [Psychrobacter sp. ASPA161_6]|uniref:hypothetical protein n=1 Tax=Psychrobacter sp. ASPA161_6 TaxID=3160962 RepID=UPI003F816971
MGTKTEQLSRRDQLAASAMQGLIIANAGKQVNSVEIAASAAKHADSLIAALAKIQA